MSLDEKNRCTLDSKNHLLTLEHLDSVTGTEIHNLYNKTFIIYFTIS